MFERPCGFDDLLSFWDVAVIDLGHRSLVPERLKFDIHGVVPSFDFDGRQLLDFAKSWCVRAGSLGSESKGMSPIDFIVVTWRRLRPW